METQKGMETQTDTDRMRREDRERDKEINHDGQIEMERSEIKRKEKINTYLHGSNKKGQN